MRMSQCYHPLIKHLSFYVACTPFQPLQSADGSRFRGARNRQDKDFVLGGLFPIHSDDAESGGGRCGLVRLERGLERMEAMLFAIDLINANTTLLANITLGFDIRDTCNSENIGLDETIDLIITGSQLDIESCQPSMRMGENGTEELMYNTPTSGIVGAAASRVSVPVASLVRLFDTPQISYASSSAILSNRDRYEYFYRTIPPDNFQARAMVDLLINFDWTYISTIYSRNPYGEPGINELHAEAEERGICIDVTVGIDDDFSDEDFRALADELVASMANVVVLFTSQDNALKLLQNIANSTAARRFIWIASDAWARSISTVHQVNETAAGLYGFAPLTFHNDEFNEYFSQLTVNNNKRNPWFPEFYAAVAECTLNETCDHDANVTQLPRYEQGNFIPLVIDAVYTYAHALQNYLNENCDSPVEWFQSNRTCRNQKRELTGALLLEYIGRTDFRSPSMNRVLFDDEGNVEGMYEILNYQFDGKEYKFVSVGAWDSSITNDSNLEALDLRDDVEFQFGLAASGRVLLEPPISQCSRCDPGQSRRVVAGACCGTCERCLGQTFSNDSLDTSCTNCSVLGEFFWGNVPLEGSTGCVDLEESNSVYLRFSDPWSIIIMILATLGLIAVTATAMIFIWYWRTPVIKSSGREQMILLLTGISVSFAVAYFYVSPPSVGICLIQRLFGVWFSFSLMFGALLVKMVRVARIFLWRSQLSRPRFTEPVYQVMFTAVIVSVQLFLIAISLIVENPMTQTELRKNTAVPDDTPEAVLTCVQDPVTFLALSMAYETILIIITTLLGVLSFKYPANFNEAKFVAFCSASLLVIWIAFIPTYFATRSRQEFQDAAISLAVVMGAAVVLVCLFGPKLFIILFQPQKNSEHYSTTHGGRDYPSSDIPLGSIIRRSAFESSETRGSFHVVDSSVPLTGKG